MKERYSELETQSGDRDSGFNLSVVIGTIDQ